METSSQAQGAELHGMSVCLPIRLEEVGEVSETPIPWGVPAHCLAWSKARRAARDQGTEGNPNIRDIHCGIVPVNGEFIHFRCQQLMREKAYVILLVK